MTNERQDFEGHTRKLLEASVDDLDGRIRSRLTQARYRALAELQHPQRASWWQWAPASAVAAVAVLAIALWAGSEYRTSAPVARATTFEDLELLVDNDVFDFVDEAPGADSYEFFEWAAVAADDGVASMGT